VLAAQARTLKAPSASGLSAKDLAIPARIAHESIAVQLNGVDAVGIDPNGRHLFLIEKGAVYEDPQTGATDSETHDLGHLVEHIAARFPHSQTHYVSTFPSGGQIERALVETMDYESVVVVVHNSSTAYRGSTDITKRFRALLDGVSHKLSAILLFGNPHAAREFPRCPRVIFGFEAYAYQDRHCETAAIDVLAGVTEAQGKLPT